jgi:chaperonin GroES
MIQDKVLIKMDSRERVTPGGIVLTDDVEATLTGDRKAIGTVLAVGPGTKKMPVDVAVGDRVVFDYYDGEHIDDKDEYRVLRCSFIWGKL